MSSRRGGSGGGGGWSRGGSGWRSGDRGALSDRRLREIGDWGEAGRFIGSRWEELGITRLRDWQRTEQPETTVVPLVGDPALGDLLRRVGVTNADVILATPVGREWLLRPLDLKWTLELATYTQISATALDDLLAKAGDELIAPLRAALGGSIGQLRSADGFFVSPPSDSNRAFLDSPHNRRREYPIEQHEVLFLPGEPSEIFADLPGWREALVVAGLDRIADPLASLDRAERYYRLGAGIRGALTKLATSLFADEPTALDVAARLTALITEVRPRGSVDLIDHVTPAMAHRQGLVARLRGLTRPPVSFGEVISLLVKRGITVARGTATDAAARAVREPWTETYRDVMAHHRRRMLRLGQELGKRGFSDEAALDHMAERLPAYEAQARQELRTAITEQLDAASSAERRPLEPM